MAAFPISYSKRSRIKYCFGGRLHGLLHGFLESVQANADTPLKLGTIVFFMLFAIDYLQITNHISTQYNLSGWETVVKQEQHYENPEESHSLHRYMKQ
jgi:hypothetical protein